MSDAPALRCEVAERLNRVLMVSAALAFALLLLERVVSLGVKNSAPPTTASVDEPVAPPPQPPEPPTLVEALGTTVTIVSALEPAPPGHERVATLRDR